MKIERINENQIRCTLSNLDLSARNLNLSELAYGSEKARGLFREMIQKASNEVGFYAEDIPLMVEAIPLANESVMLIITKIEDPEELDTRFSKFAPAYDEDDNTWSALANEFLEGADGILNLFDGTGKKSPDSPDGADASAKKDDSAQDTQTVRIFVFDTLDHVCEAARAVDASFSGTNVLYKSPARGNYYLVVKRDNNDELVFSRLCNTLSEYGSHLRQIPAAEAYYREHYETIIKKDALQTLAKL